MSKSRFMQTVHTVNVTPASVVALADDIFNGSPTTLYVNMSNYDKATFVLNKAAGATGTATITVKSADDISGTNATAIAFDYMTCTSGDTFSDTSTATTAGFATTAGTNQQYVLEVNSSELSGTQKYVAVNMAEVVNSPVSGQVLCIMSGPRFTHEVMKTAIV